jgi:diguanylate cyclase (GGDEF)-like protein/PAS domain S-box-containing protein
MATPSVFKGFKPHVTRRNTPAFRARAAIAGEHVGQALRAADKYSIYTLDAAGCIRSWNSGATHQMQYRANEVIGHPFRKFFSMEDAGAGTPDRELNRASAAGSCAGEFWLTRKDGTRFWARVVLTSVTRGPRRAASTSFIVITHDLTDLKLREERVQAALNGDEQAVICTDGRQVVTFMNAEAERTTEWTAERAIGTPIGEVLRVVDKHGGLCRFAPRRWQSHHAHGERRKISGTLLSRFGRSLQVEVTVLNTPGPAGQPDEALIVYSDRSKSARLHRELIRAETHDWLTGLPNRAAFEARLDQVLHQYVENGRAHALCTIDLHGFRMVNVSDGSLAGDTLLRQVGRVLAHELRETDVLARIGSNEFGLLLLDCRLQQAQRICARLLQEIRAMEFVWGERVYELGASFGITQFTDNSRSVSDLMCEAGVAQASAKAAGRNQILTYTTGSGDVAREHSALRIAANIKSAIKANRLRLYGQEIRALAASEDARPHVEILVRMIDEAGQLILPGMFIPVAERNNLMLDIDRWVIGSVIRDLGPLVADIPHVVLSINLSANSLNDPSFLWYMQDLLDESVLPPDRLCFEVTETALITNVAQAASLIERVRACGCSVMLDDFGTGVSSFQYLRQFPVDYIKIDGHFVKDIVSNSIDRAIVESIHEISGKLGARTIAEFVESSAIIGVLDEIGIDYAQGYAIGRPMPVADLLETMRVAVEAR